MLSRRKFIGVLAALPSVGYAAAQAAAAAGDDARIVSARIHPAIGIARVGNSLDGFFLAPEVSDARPLPLGGYRDATGAIKRQVARFRIYGYDSAGAVVRELTADDATIVWTAHLANKKAAWYEFLRAFDLPEVSQPGALFSRRRNEFTLWPNRGQLVIDPGPRSIQGPSVQGPSYRFDTGRFFKLAVPLGELRTDERGRLLVFGGSGLARSVDGIDPVEVSNNDGWHDDSSDGPIEAKVTLAGREIPVEGAWAVVAMPNYAPALKSVRTVYDLLFDLAIAWGFEAPPAQVSFTRHIAPIFRRLTALQWVNAGIAAEFGVGQTYEAGALLPKLADASEGNREFRRQIHRRFRNPATGVSGLGGKLWPPLYGDNWEGLNNQEADVTMRIADTMHALSPTQLGWLAKWAEGGFLDDHATAPPPPGSLDEVSPAERPAALDRAALDFCLADSFHPGIELTWILRRRSLWSGWMRLRRRPAGQAEPDYGATMEARAALAEPGPLSASGPGDLTRWMAVPWQTDAVSCLYGYDNYKTSTTLPSFWPARVPNQVLTEANWRRSVDPALPLAQRQAAFAARHNWYRVFSTPEDGAAMVRDWPKLGMIEERPGAPDLPGLAAPMLVETKPGLHVPEDRAAP